MTSTLIERLSTSEDPRELTAIVEELVGEIVVGFEQNVSSARRGSPPAIRSYIQNWRALESWALAAFASASADLAVETDEGVLLVDAKGIPSHHLTQVLEQEALHAPFSVWVQALGEGPGVAVHLIAAVRRLTGRRPVSPPDTFLRPLLFAEASDSLNARRFLRLAQRELEAELDPLDRVADLFALTDTDLGRLFGVSRQRVSQWRTEGVPVVHQPKLTTMARIADLLEHNLISERIAGIVRRTSPGFEDESLLEAIEHDRHEEALKRVEESFNWATTA